MNENKNTKLKSTIKGANNYISTFGIITPENPMGIKSSPEENNKLLKNMKRDLKALHYDYTKIHGKYNDKERPFFIYNVNLRDMFYLASKNKYNQESFIYGELHNNEVSFYYYDKAYDDDNHTLSDKCDSVTNQTDADDFFTSLGDYRFNISFPIFEEISQGNLFIESNYGYKPHFVVELDEIIYDKVHTLNSLRKKRAFLYETKTDRDSRVKRIK